MRQSPGKADRADAQGLDLSKFKDDWYRFIIHKLFIDCRDSADLLQNDVHFITFNYDVSLERSLRQALHNIELFKEHDIGAFFSPNRILHVYGKVRDVPPVTPPRLLFDIPDDHDRFGVAHKETLDALYNAAKNLRVIDPLKEVDNPLIETARELIERARCVYILGYGFDQNNSRRLGLRQALHYEKNRKCVLFTNFQCINRITKGASKVLFGHPSQTFEVPIGNVDGNYYFEMSSRDAYEAFELDFDALEEQLTGGTPI